MSQLLGHTVGSQIFELTVSTQKLCLILLSCYIDYAAHQTVIAVGFVL